MTLRTNHERASRILPCGTDDHCSPDVLLDYFCGRWGTSELAVWPTSQHAARWGERCRAADMCSLRGCVDALRRSNVDPQLLRRIVDHVLGVWGSFLNDEHVAGYVFREARRADPHLDVTLDRFSSDETHPLEPEEPGNSFSVSS